ncbi:ubiquitin-like modifier-activating enzyme 1 [Reticulomyxa filosa]|uniref:Ubiquitin-like modifier-activating enzyme 1 n=1 Tax=Reticulomyxa filosa TaxID=46433 RepID=X6NNB9_RETFI|nr:ubiquitin-like modifier-activating enzyme 1 [Reticulomyxa filosa]|eukprot:ETO26862.1 ubiquitin-like modifier-activating enzyme 1 [Reticulomyxa filosa]
MNDLSSQFYLKESDIKNHRTRASACVDQLQELNRHVTVTNIGKELSPRLLQESDFQVVVLVNYPLEDQIKYGSICYELGINSLPPRGWAFLFFFIIHLTTCFFLVPFFFFVENNKNGIHGSASPAVVQVHEDQRHGLETGDWVRFEEIKGMTELNNRDAVQIKFLTPFTFEIDDTSSFSEYKGEGLYFQVKKPKRIAFSRLQDQLKTPSFLMSDFTKDCGQRHIFYQVHNFFFPLCYLIKTKDLSFFALCAFRQKNGRFPHPTSEEDANAVVQKAKEIENAEEGKSSLNEKILFGLARCSSAVINPMAAFLGGVVGQEVLKACTGKFSPIHQILYFDAFEALPSADVPLTQYAPLHCRYDDNIAVFGKDLQEKVLNAKF